MLSLIKPRILRRRRVVKWTLTAWISTLEINSCRCYLPICTRAKTRTANCKKKEELIRVAYCSRPKRSHSHCKTWTRANSWHTTPRPKPISFRYRRMEDSFNLLGIERRWLKVFQRGAWFLSSSCRKTTLALLIWIRASLIQQKKITSKWVWKGHLWSHLNLSRW